MEHEQIEKIFPGDGSGSVLVGFGIKISERNSAIFALQDILLPDDAPVQIVLSIHGFAENPLEQASASVMAADTRAGDQRQVNRSSMILCFKELKRDIGSAETQTRNSVAVTNHLEFCMMATTLTWVYACRLEKTPSRRHAVKGRGHFAFSDVRRPVAKATMDDNFAILCPVPRKSMINSLATAFMRMAA